MKTIKLLIVIFFVSFALYTIVNLFKIKKEGKNLELESEL